MLKTKCRPDCGACCIAPSIRGSIPNMPNGKAAGEICINLDTESHLCKIWETDMYPDVCRQFMPEASICGDSQVEALRIITDLENHTLPDSIN